MTHETIGSRRDRAAAPSLTRAPRDAAPRPDAGATGLVGGIDYDEVLEETFPASDPPPGPATLPKRLVTNVLRRAARATRLRS